MELTYLGHSTFLLTAGDGTTILIDPFDPGVGYPMPDVSPTAVTVSHEHRDHNYLEMASGSPHVIRGLALGGKEWATVDERVGPVHITTVPTYHDPTGGSARGRNTIFVYDVDGLRIVHLGDLGHTLDAEQVEAVGRPDVLMVPVGGHYTIGPNDADKVIRALNPQVVIPMHYKTAFNEGSPIGRVEEFIQGKAGVSRQGRRVTVAPEAQSGGTQIWVLSHEE